MTTKWIIERAVFRDDRGDPDRAWMLDLKPLPSSGRLVMCALLSRCNAETGHLDADHSPSLSELSELTGLDRSTVRRVLNALEKACWVIRDRPDPAAARANGARTSYRLGVPGKDGMPMPTDDEVEAGNPQGRGTTPPPKAGKVEAPRPQSGGTTPPPVGAQCTTGRGTTPLIPLSTPDRPTEDLNHQRAGANAKPGKPDRKARPGDGMLPLPVEVTTPRRPASKPPTQPPTVVDPDPRPAALIGVADELVNGWAKALHPNPMPRSDRKKFLAKIDELLADGFTTEQIRDGLRLLWKNRHRYGIGMLPTFVQQAIAAAEMPTNVHRIGGRRETATEVLDRVEAQMNAGTGAPAFTDFDDFDTSRIVDSIVINPGATA